MSPLSYKVATSSTGLLFSSNLKSLTFETLLSFDIAIFATIGSVSLTYNTSGINVSLPKNFISGGL